MARIVRRFKLQDDVHAARPGGPPRAHSIGVDVACPRCGAEMAVLSCSLTRNGAVLDCERQGCGGSAFRKNRDL